MSYRIHGVKTMSWDEGKATGWPTVASDEWSFSTSSLSRWMSSASVVEADDGKHTLNAHRTIGPTFGDTEDHPLNGTKYDTAAAADRAGYEAGLLFFFESVKDGGFGRLEE